MWAEAFKRLATRTRSSQQGLQRSRGWNYRRKKHTHAGGRTPTKECACVLAGYCHTLPAFRWRSGEIPCIVCLVLGNEASELRMIRSLGTSFPYPTPGYVSDMWDEKFSKG